MRRAHTHKPDGRKRRHRRGFKSPTPGYRDRNKYKVTGELKILDDFNGIQEEGPL